MVKTFNERSKEAIHRHYNCNYPCECFNDCVYGCGSNQPYDCNECDAGAFSEGYYVGATDQRKIDTEKALKWLKDMLITQQASLDFIEEALKMFRKAMEE